MNTQHLEKADEGVRQAFAALHNIVDALCTVIQVLQEADKRINWAYGEYKKEHEHEGEGKPE